MLANLEESQTMEEYKATTGHTTFIISNQSPQEPSPLLKTPNISEAVSLDEQERWVMP